MESVGTGSCFGSFGEFLQGVLPGGEKFLVNCRIRNSSKVMVRLSAPLYLPEKEEEYARSYAHFPKTYKGLRNFLSDLGRHDDCLIAVRSDIPTGKGLSSSTADMVAGVRALAEALSLKLRSDYLSRMLSEIEPNDGLHFDNTSAYCHITGRLIANIDWVPPFRILGIDQGGMVDTVTFNRCALSLAEADIARYGAMLDEVLAAMEARDLARIGALATESARMWNPVNPKADLETVLDLARSLGALGVVNTHSGTYLGLLFADDGALDEAAIAEMTARRLPDREIAWYATTGCRQSENLSKRAGNG